HDTEDQREPAREQEQERAVREAVEGLDDPELGGHESRESPRASPPRTRAWSVFPSRACLVMMSRGRSKPMSKQKSLPSMTRSAPTVAMRYRRASPEWLIVS